MSKYRQRATVEAKQWLDEACAGYGAEDPKNPGAIIALGLVRTGDWIVTEDDGSMRVLSDMAFNRTYESADSP